MKYRLIAIFALGTMSALAAGQLAPPSLPTGAKLFISPMEWGLDRFVTAQITKQALPVQLVASEDDADFVMTSHYQGLGSHLIAPGHYIQVKVVAAKSGKSVWNDEVNDFAIFFGRLRRHGPGKAAQEIVKKLRHKVLGAQASN